MHNNKTLALSLLTTLLVITGCTQNQTVFNANDSTTANSPVNENVNTPVNNTNTIESDVDTSDWLTYTNEEYGFSFRYPGNWMTSANDNNIGCISDVSIVCDVYSYGKGSFDDFPVEYVHGKIVIENSESFSKMSEKEILMIEPGKETMPLMEENFLTINKFPAYRSLRQLKKGELLYPTAPGSTEKTEQTWTEIEYRYFYGSNLVRLTFSIQGENYQKFYDIIDLIGQSFASTAVDTSDWLTYTNEDYGFSFKYPMPWLLKVNDAGLVSLTNETSHVRAKIVVLENVVEADMDDATALKFEDGREPLSLVSEEFISINGLSSYRAFRQLKKGESIFTADELNEVTRTAIEYTYLNEDDLFRVWFTIDGENTEPFYDIVDAIGKSFSM
ncbi:MAG: hypothetical protein A3B74_01200 [Candidatus Kerfeldbacteria bacterium RIFCSPHIGHO2_02_FULL_42_14]|uniref:Uncharacterized protein n=1 Tax=Candidatus Kerfeldbacteria bacterium RIFCSPHIGHO2_02_FULL_42_14 TaxID=1798540 RepID=A0A1G2AN69_9BACT|nr:MAG: hypothetical protein A3B74_01200 [Candidatus Kerfeldbacteria bacterium RIFCSPHIGHO2_02_FULL_42_14]OGY81121.1 MAG: hypothetical protein A3E60_04665 [Candidatus Kerfeldbacteria bacterium RIFCSPHIGHO2_12_FULL_42_13]OGY84201.1 MAG: hypothetical protein A3I91_05390 [Candidatus Kerfeldbacteria bacterium RIFCSPLOWO2_02_FULL_42_19]OGY87476.1 MAG: hypothetical protein A3G01_02380 [Candidatus Kerfeldbacteria bacterium RIFCSPLOWO2_12_FULL_43_9]